MKTITSKLPNSFNVVRNELNYGLRVFNLNDDFLKIYNWMHQTHVIPQWQLNKSEVELYVYFEKMVVDDHQKLYIITINNIDVGYLELYEAKRDRLGLYYEAEINDIGWHILIGNINYVGKGHFKNLMRMICFFVFENTSAEKIVGEPDINVRSYKYVEKEIAFEQQSKIYMKEKTAVLYHCYRQIFLKLHENYFRKI